jgi:hypothetical protein
MYLGWNDGAAALRSNETEIVGVVFSFLRRNPIWLITDSLISTAEGEKLKTVLGEFGTEVLQFNAQQSCAALTEEISIRCFLQHSIVDIPFWSPEKKGVPANAKLARPRNKDIDVSHLAIICNSIPRV